MINKEGIKDLYGCFGNITAAIIGGVVMLFVHDKLPFINDYSNYDKQEVINFTNEDWIEITEMMTNSMTNFGNLEFEKSLGELGPYQKNYNLSTLNSNVTLKNFLVEAKFQNPPNKRLKNWTYGFGFRSMSGNQNYRLYFRSEGSWQLDFVDGTTDNGDLNSKSVASGGTSVFRKELNDFNYVKLLILDSKGLIFLNGRIISKFDIFDNVGAGKVWIGASFLKNDSFVGEKLKFQGFRVYRIGK